MAHNGRALPLAAAALAVVAGVVGGVFAALPASHNASLAAASSGGRTAIHHRGVGYYLALGDSLAVGVQPDAAGRSVPTREGYPDQLAAMLRLHHHGVRLVKRGCSGETTGSMINGGPYCSYRAYRSQLGAAAAFLARHRRHVRLVTIDIGANDLNACQQPGVDVLQCLNKAVPAAVANLGTIMKRLRRAGGPHLPIIGMTYYDPALAQWLTGSSGQTYARFSESVIASYNGQLAAVYKRYGARVADVATTFRMADFTDLVTLPGYGQVPVNVALICRWTWECAAAPRGPNEHPNTTGYRAIARTFLAATDYGRRLR